ncbi:hypothetical protein PYW08_011200 [Mythimna loreyi]|uniref:Uncharacterized protein n=1 Tax=Mythimna loreyi TaxID=667449 RepID=A0ACC2Q4J4_9NEOP|nr:hypothetical protein PYW08_011200 [Mythimna loreyi]
MDFFRNFKKIIPRYLRENMTTDTEITVNITREPHIDQSLPYADDNCKLETKGNVSSEDVVTDIDSSIVSIDEFGVTKSLHNLENVVPIEISTNDMYNTYQELEQNEITAIEDTTIINNAAAVNLVTNVTEDENFINTSSGDLNDSALVSIDEFGVTKSLHNLENVVPIEISTNDMYNTYQELEQNEITAIEDTTIINNAAAVNLVTNITEDENVINTSNVDLNEIKVTNIEAVSNCVNSSKADKVIDDETIQGLKEFETVLNNINTPVITDEFELEVLNLDEFDDLFDQMEAGNEEVISTNSSDNDQNATCNEEELTDPIAIKSNLNENFDIISINSSIEDEKGQTEKSKDTMSHETSSDDGYNSSDFEFISESEANMAGIIINYQLENHQNLSQANSEPIIFCFDEENRQENEQFDPGEGPSRQNRPRNEFEDRRYRNDHRVPIGDDYLGLFQGIYNPLLPMSDILFLENKSVRTSAMNIQYAGIGFEKQLVMRRHQPDSSEDEFEDEAKESAKKILNMYPGANRKRPRRHRFL